MDPMTRTSSALLGILLAVAGCTATPPPTQAPTPTPSATPTPTIEQPKPSLKCEDVPAKVQTMARRIFIAAEVSDIVGDGAMVRGGTSPEGREWRVVAFKRSGGPAEAILWTLPADKGGRDEFSQISSKWTGSLAEFRGFLKWGVEARAAAVACLN